MGVHSSTYRASNTASIGKNWFNVEDIYDDPNILSYAYREATSTSAIHINGFGINLPSTATVNSVEVHTKAYLSNYRGYLCIYLCSDVGATRVIYSQVANGASLPSQYVTQTYSADTLVAKLNEKGIHNGDLLDFLKNVRVRIVAGSTSSNLSSKCNIYDNYIVVNHTIPEFAITANAGTGGTVTGGGSYESGTTATLTATPSSGYIFKQWSDGNTSNPRSVTVSANATYTAQFEKVRTSNLFIGTQRVTAYCGTKKMSTYCGTKKI